MSGTKYPNQVDGNNELVLSIDNVTQVKSQVVNDLRSAIIAVETELGLDPSGIYATVRARLDALTALIASLQGGGNGNANLTTLPPTTLIKGTPQVGVVQLAALSDHRHDISTASATSVGAVNSEGNSSFLSRADHTHATIDLAISGQVQGSILYFNGSNWVTLAPSTDGLVLTTHNSGANPTWTASNGTALTNIAPLDVSKSTALVGIGTTAAREDHKHSISTAAPISIANANSEGVATSLARSDHLHALAGTVGGDLTGTLPNPTVTGLHITGATQGSVLYYNGTSWITLNPGTDGYVLTTHSTGQNPSWTQASGGGVGLSTLAPLNVDNTAASVGVAITAARGDHKHQINPGTAVSIGATNSQGSATTLSLSDHQHQVVDLHLTSQTQGSVIYFNGTNWVVLPPNTAGDVLTTNGVAANPSWTAIPAGITLTSSAPVNIDKAAAIVGVATTAARADHKHSANTNTAVSISTINAEGTATTLSRSDHTHQVTNFTIASQAIGDLLVFNGTSWVVLPPSTAGLILTANGVGAAPTYQAAPTGVTLSTTTPADVNAGAGTVGVGTTASRSDHVHQVDVSTPVSIGASNVQGVATSLTRSDHQHQVVDLHIASQVQGNILYFNGTNWVVLANGTAGQALTTNGASANPTWSSVTTLTAVAPVNVDGTAAAVGVATTAARQDHKHNVNFGSGVSIGATNSAGTATTLSRSDHTHSVTDLAIAGETKGDIIFFNGTNWVRLAGGQDGYVLTTHSTVSNPTWNLVGGGGGGVTSVFTRTGGVVAVLGDYTSSLITNASTVTGATVTAALNTLLTDITSLPIVSLSNIAPVNVDGVAASAGIANAAARQDHKHNVNFGTPVSIGTANSAGTATTTVRSDHTHLVNAFSITSQVQGSVLYFNGTSWVVLATGTAGQVLTTGGASANPTWTSVAALASIAPVNVDGTAAAVGVGTTAARQDHKHSVNFSTPVSISTTNSAGTATTLVRSDHTHAGVASIFGRNGTVTAQVGDYVSSQIGNDSAVNGASGTVQGALDSLLGEYASVVITTATAYTLAGTDNDVLYLVNTTGLLTVTVPTNASAAFTVGGRVSFMIFGASAFTSFTEQVGVTLNISGSPIGGQWSVAHLDKIALNTWVLSFFPISLAASQVTNDSSVFSGAGSVQDALNQLLRKYQSVFTTTATTYTLVSTDIDCLYLVNTSGTLTVTVPTTASVPFGAGGQVSFMLFGASSALAITPAAGVTLHTAGNPSTDQWSTITLTKIAINTWVISYLPTVLDSTQIANFSFVSGATVTDALNTITNYGLIGDVSIPLNPATPGAWSFNSTFLSGAHGGWYGQSNDSLRDPFSICLGPIPVNANLTKIVVRIRPKSGHGGLPTQMPQVDFYLMDGGGSVDLVTSVVDTSSSVPIYEGPHTITVSGFSISPVNQSLFINIYDERGTNAIGLTRLIDIVITLA